MSGATAPGNGGRAILPGQSLGMLGSGQLGRMFTLAAKQMGYRVHVLAADADDPAAQVADRVIVAGYGDTDAVARLARGVAVVTLEFENIPAAVIDAAERHAPVRPGRLPLMTCQHRVREKTFLRDAGIPVAPFVAIENEDELRDAVRAIGTPAVLKTAAWGYDGKGQAKITTPAEAAAAWRDIGEQPAVLEGFIDFRMEISVVVARGLDGRSVTYGPIANDHANHILDVSVFPANVSPKLALEAQQLASAIAERFDYVGVLCVEFFVTGDERVLVNEIAPRPHNSGHLTIDGFVTSQFEQQVRAVCGLPLGDASPLASAVAMANLLGDVWAEGEPRWHHALGDGSVKLHLYGKAEARVGRKMGHLTACAADPAAARAAVRRARARLIEPMLSRPEPGAD